MRGCTQCDPRWKKLLSLKCHRCHEEVFFQRESWRACDLKREFLFHGGWRLTFFRARARSMKSKFGASLRPKFGTDVFGNIPKMRNFGISGQNRFHAEEWMKNYLRWKLTSWPDPINSFSFCATILKLVDPTSPKTTRGFLIYFSLLNLE